MLSKTSVPRRARPAITPDRAVPHPALHEAEQRSDEGLTEASAKGGIAVDDAVPEWVQLAHILRPQGRKGEVLAELLTDFPERFEGGPRVFLAKPEFAGRVEDAQATHVSGFFLPLGKNQGRVVLHLSAANSIEEAATLGGLDVLVPGEERLPLEDDASYISDLIGCVVLDTVGSNDGGVATLIGTVDDVHLPTTADGTRRLNDAAPLLSVLSASGAEILIPFAKAFLVEVDVDGKRIVMSLPSGLVDINA